MKLLRTRTKMLLNQVLKTKVHNDSEYGAILIMVEHLEEIISMLDDLIITKENPDFN